jgi:formylmethanofuran dehydrogenase subunit C
MTDLHRVTIALHPFGSKEAAENAAAAIRATGSISYVNAEGSDVSVTVGDVTVEGDVNKS